MKKNWWKIILIMIFVGGGVLFIYSGKNTRKANVVVSQSSVVTPELTRIPTEKPTEMSKQFATLDYPVAEFKNRITKKHFGTFVTPVNSPVKPEKFRGYHTGVDVEYGDVVEDVKVVAIADGEIVYAGYVNGYGGFEAMKFSFEGKEYIATYGHLRQSFLLKKGDKVNKGQIIGILGKGFSKETDGERKHLHFGIIKGTRLDLRGYVQKEEELKGWVDPEKML